MTKEQLENRVEELKKAMEQSAANHNALAGRLAERLEELKTLESNQDVEECPGKQCS